MQYRTWMMMMMALAAMSANAAGANVFNMGSGLTNLETVFVGDLYNTADSAVHSGNSAGQGAVTYEYSIAKYEVTAAQYTVFLNAVAATDTYGLYNPSMSSDDLGCKIQRSGTPGSYSYSVAVDYANRPVNYVSWGDAARFANWLHNREPGLETPVPQDQYSTEDGMYSLNGATTNATLMAVSRNTNRGWAIASGDEWYKAAYYKGGSSNAGYWDYATSSNTVPSNVLGTPDPGNTATYYANGVYTVGSPYYRTEAGEHENSFSAYGTFDQSGNVWEWNEASNGTRRETRGGAFGDVFASYLSSSVHNYASPTAENSTVGFRVVTVPEPASAILLAGIVAALLCYWRKRI